MGGCIKRSVAMADSTHGECGEEEWRRLVDQAVNRLLEEGVRRGDRVIVCLHSDLSAAVLITALRKLGAVVVPLSPATPHANVERARELTGARLVVIGVNLRAQCALEVLPTQSDDAVSTRQDPPRNLAAILFTSGTNGLPKAVMLSEEGLEYQAQVTARVLEYGSEDVLCLPIPVWSSYGFSVLLAAEAAGASVFLTSFRSPEAVVVEMLNHRCTSFDAVPAIYYALVRYLERHPDVATTLSKQVRLFGVGGDKTPKVIWDRFVELMGKPLLEGYGLTEAGPNVAISSPKVFRPGTCGRPLPGTEIRLLEGRRGEPGELLVKSPSVMLGYWSDPAATAAVLQDGWLHTGDLAEVDSDGFLRIVGRASRLIITAGRNVAPAEVENALLQVPGVRDAVVIGIPHTWRGETVAACVVTEWSLSPTEIVHALSTKLEKYKIPRIIRFVDAIPRNQNGKPDYYALKALISTLALGDKL